MRKKNPYDPAKAASANLFIGRQELKDDLTNGLQNGYSFGLVGKPGMGKTSLLMALQKELIAKQDDQELSILPLPLYIECQRSHEGVEDIFLIIIEQFIEQFKTQRQLSQEPPDAIRNQAEEAAKRGRLQVALKQLLDWAYQQEPLTHRPILLVDNFHRISDKPWFYDLASILQTSVNREPIALLLAGKQALAGEFRDDTSPLRLLITQYYTLQPLTSTESYALVAKALEYGWQVEDGSAELAYNLTKGHPYRLHYYLFGVLSKEGKVSKDGLNAIHNDPDTRKWLQHLFDENELEQTNAGTEKDTALNDETDDPTANTKANFWRLLISFLLILLVIGAVIATLVFVAERLASNILFGLVVVATILVSIIVIGFTLRTNHIISGEQLTKLYEVVVNALPVLRKQVAEEEQKEKTTV